MYPVSRVHGLPAMKVLVGDLTIAVKKWGWDELGILTVIRERDSQQWGYRHVRHLLDNFTHKVQMGPHLSRVGGDEPQCSRRISCASRPMPLPLLKRMSKYVLRLRALQYLNECGIIHTGNIFLHSC